MKITDEDRRMMKALLHLLEKNGRFSLDIREAVAFIKLYRWTQDLDGRMNKKDKEINITEPTDAD